MGKQYHEIVPLKHDEGQKWHIRRFWANALPVWTFPGKGL
jgi:hypothetical protein